MPIWIWDSDDKEERKLLKFCETEQEAEEFLAKLRAMPIGKQNDENN